MDRLVEDEVNRKMLVQYINQHPLPFTVHIEKGRHRSTEQNRTQFLWFAEIARDTGNDIEDVRAFCKYKFGIPILIRDDPKMYELYKRALEGLPYQKRLALMTDPVSLPVTSLMRVPQMSEYMDRIYQFFTQEQGLKLTLPEEETCRSTPVRRSAALAATSRRKARSQ